MNSDHEDKKVALRVSSKSSVLSVAGSIVKFIEEDNQVDLHAIGASAVNQATKALATASGMIATKGYELLVKVGFSSTTIDGQECTMIVFRVIIR